MALSPTPHAISTYPTQHATPTYPLPHAMPISLSTSCLLVPVKCIQGEGAQLPDLRALTLLLKEQTTLGNIVLHLLAVIGNLVLQVTLLTLLTLEHAGYRGVH